MMKWQLAFLFGALIGVPATVQAQWYATVDFAAMARGDKSDTVFQRDQIEVLDKDGNPTGVFQSGSVILQAGDLDLGLTAGGRLAAGYRGGLYGLEGCYTLSDDWTSNQAVESTALSTDLAGLMASPFSMSGTYIDALSPVDNNYSAAVAYTTEMESGELHLTRVVHASEYGQARMLLGVRYLSVSEMLSYTSSNYTTDITVATNVNNQLIGPQVGLLVEAIAPGGFLDLDLKFAVAYNSIDKTTEFNGFPGAGGESAAATMFEFGVNYRVQPTPHLAVQIGYRLVAIDAIALATDNFESNLVVLNSGNATVATDSAFYHSPYVGVVISR